MKVKLNEKKMTAAVIGAYTRSYFLFTKSDFIKANFCRQKTITEKEIPTPKPNPLIKASKVCMRHFKDCNYECYEWLTANTSYFVDRVYFLIRVKGHGMTDPWTLFTSDR